MPRQARLDTPGTLHHVIIRGIEKRAIVEDDIDRGRFISRLGELATETETGIYAWALMTNHAHILLKSGPAGLSYFMRRMLTGYAINYNKRHKRHGHLFQNRYKSIVCDEEEYFLELVRYIHLNPLRAQIVNDMTELDSYPWSGHSVVMGYRKREWQDRQYVLSMYGKREKAARKVYRQFVEEGIEEGRREDLVGGGLVRSSGGWSQVLSRRKDRDRDLSDERILGSSDFVERIIGEAEEAIRYQLPLNERRIVAQKRIDEICNREGINVKELKGGSRRTGISRARAILAIELVEEYGLTLAEAGRQLGVTTPAVSKILKRNKTTPH